VREANEARIVAAARGESRATMPAGQRPPPRGGERGCGTVAQQGRAERVRHYEATFFGDQDGRKVVRHSEIKPVRELSIPGPFTVRAEISERALDLDDDEVTGSAERQDVGTLPADEREFEQAGITELVERAAHAAR